MYGLMTCTMWRARLIYLRDVLAGPYNGERNIHRAVGMVVSQLEVRDMGDVETSGYRFTAHGR